MTKSLKAKIIAPLMITLIGISTVAGIGGCRNNKVTAQKEQIHSFPPSENSGQTYVFGNQEYPVEDPYAFRSNPDYGLPANQLLWDYKIKIKEGDNLWNIHKELGINPQTWQETVETNQYFKFLGKDFNPNKDLQPGQTLVIYLPFEDVGVYQERFPGRDLDFYRRP